MKKTKKSKKQPLEKENDIIEIIDDVTKEVSKWPEWLLKNAEAALFPVHTNQNFYKKLKGG